MKAAGGGIIINNIGNAGERYDAAYIAGTTGNASLMAFTRALGGPRTRAVSSPSAFWALSGSE
jgi:hypothetical protein